ncbi:MAG: DUF998 domain-containing protein [Phycisphaerales bacterium]|nr:DUF998 domain-containing protein [Phycisphaerales bacterium]
MPNRPTLDAPAIAALRLGIAIPFIYYGMQVLSACFFPGYSYLRNTASELGSDLSPHAGVFNIGIMALGAITLIAGQGLLWALLRLGNHPLIAALTLIAMGTNAVQSFWAGCFPMPDPRHGGTPGVHCRDAGDPAAPDGRPVEAQR